MSRIHEAIRRAEEEGKTSPMARNSPKILPQAPTGVPFQGHIFSRARTTGKDGVERVEGVATHQDNELSEIKSLISPQLVLNLPLNSVACEQYRGLKAKLFDIRQKGPLKTILVTSTAASEGKTLNSLNLALTLSGEIDQKVLLIDTDLRKPSVHKILGLDGHIGLADFLKGTVSIDEGILKTHIPNFSVVAGGAIPHNPTELLNTELMRRFLASATEQYDWLVLDSPPLLAVADSVVLSSLTDGVLVVVKGKGTHADMLKKGLELLRGRNLLGFIFNFSQEVCKSKYHYYYGNKNPDIGKRKLRIDTMLRRE
ncbi:MAG TPA: CpsD/CapB family tyrosine-protein kinase [Terriglobia bacterium]|nr:CpsD/CapB family tyrosine-protein kinase [Terriglobia bacterium]